MFVKQCRPGWVLVEIDDSNEWIKLSNGVTLWLDTSYEPEKHAQVHGKVVLKCDKVNFMSPYDVDVEVEIGDDVVFHYLCVVNAITYNRVHVEGGKKYVFIEYQDLFAAYRDGKTIPLNGYIFVEPDEEINTKYYADDFDFRTITKKTTTKSMTRGTVKHVGIKCRNYPTYDNDSDEMLDVNVGDKVIFSPEEAIPLILGDDSLYRTHRIFVYPYTTTE